MNYVYLLAVACLLAASSAAAFVVPNASSITPRPDTQRAFYPRTSCVLRLDKTGLAKAKGGKKPALSVEENEKGIDYGKVLLLFVDPRNPYSWFLYMLGFIITFGTVSGN
jgi:hypothetical protein